MENGFSVMGYFFLKIQCMLKYDKRPISGLDRDAGLSVTTRQRLLGLAIRFRMVLFGTLFSLGPAWQRALGLFLAGLTERKLLAVGHPSFQRCLIRFKSDWSRVAHVQFQRVTMTMVFDNDLHNKFRSIWTCLKVIKLCSR